MNQEKCAETEASKEDRVKNRQLYRKPRTENISRRESPLVLTLLGSFDETRTEPWSLDLVR